MAAARKSAPSGRFDALMNGRTGYYDIRRGGVATGVRFGDRRRAETFARKQNERVDALGRAAAWTKRPPSHVQARLLNPVKGRGAMAARNPIDLAALRGDVVQAIKERTAARLGLTRRRPPAGPVELVRELRDFDARVETAMARLRRAERGGPVAAAVAANPFSPQLRDRMRELTAAQAAHRAKPTAASKTKLDKARARFEAAADKDRGSNPDWFRDKFGRPHPIRGSKGYEDAFPGMSRADKKYLRSGSDQPRGGYTVALPKAERAARVEAAARERVAKAKKKSGVRSLIGPAYERGTTKAQKEAAANRKRRIFGAA